MAKQIKSASVSIGEISKHPTMRLDAEFWVGKKNGKKAFKKDKEGNLIEDDATGKTMLTDDEAKKYNKATSEIKKLKRHQRHNREN